MVEEPPTGGETWGGDVGGCEVPGVAIVTLSDVRSAVFGRSSVARTVRGPSLSIEYVSKRRTGSGMQKQFNGSMETT